MNAIVIKWMLVTCLMLGSAAGFAHPSTSQSSFSTDIQLNEPPENDPPLQPDPNKEDEDEDEKGKKKEKKENEKKPTQAKAKGT
jgi:hypothetical protein